MHATEDGARRLAGQLLIDDRPNECVEVGAFSPRLESAGADAIDDFREHRIDALEMTYRGAVHAGRMRRPRRRRHIPLWLPTIRRLPALGQLPRYLLEIG